MERLFGSNSRPVAGRRWRPGRRWGRGITAALVSVILPVGAVACAKKEDNTAGQAAKKVELSVLWWGGAARQDLTNKVLDLYTSKHPNVTFKRVSQDWNGYYDRLESVIASGEPADMFQLDDNALTDYANRDIAIDMSSYMGPKKVIDTSRFPESLVEYSKVAGTLRATPIASNTQSVFYDKTLLQQDGLPEPQIGWTYEQYFAWAAQITAKSGGKAPFGMMDASGSIKVFWSWLRTQGKEVYNGNKLGFEAADVQRWFEMWANARKGGALASPDLVHTANSNSLATQLVVTKNAGASFMWSNQLAEAQKATDHQLGITSYPGDPKGQWARASMYWAISKASKNAAQVADVINFFVNDPAAGAILGTERGLPANLDIRTQIASSLSPAMQTTMRFETELLPKLGTAPAPPPKGHSSVEPLLTAAAENVLYGRNTIQQATDVFMKQAAQALPA
jgi:pectin-derived oligosaccharide transport system substrate-binding protein